MKDLDGNVFYDEDGRSITGESSSRSDRLDQSMHGGLKKTLADQLIYVAQDYEDFLGSTYDKHVKLYKYYQVLMFCLKNPKDLIYPSMDSFLINFHKLHSITTEMSVSGDPNQIGISQDPSNLHHANQQTANVPILPKTLAKVL